MILDETNRVPDGWRLVACRHTFRDTANLVTVIVHEIEGEQISVNVANLLGVGRVQFQTLVVAPTEQPLSEVATYVGRAWRDTMGLVQRNTCIYGGVFAHSGNGDTRETAWGVGRTDEQWTIPDDGPAVALALLVTFQTASRPRRLTGRIHVPGLHADHVDIGSGWVTPSGIVAINDALFAFDNAVEDSGYVPVVGNPRLEPNHAWPVIGMTVRRQLQPQRRRKYDSLSEARNVVRQFL